MTDTINRQPTETHTPSLTLRTASWAAGLACAFGLYLALFAAPTDTLLGPIQRLFYLHLAAFTGAFVGFATAMIGGLAYLRTRRPAADHLALAGVEVGLVLAVINVVTGSIYARAVVNSWWTWDPKLTAVAVMMLTYAAYLMLRHGLENPDRQRLFAAVYGVLAFFTVIYTIVIIRVRSDVLHTALFEPGSALFASMPAPFRTTLFVNMFIWGAVLAPVLMAWRIRLSAREDALKQRRAALLYR